MRIIDLWESHKVTAYVPTICRYYIMYQSSQTSCCMDVSHRASARFLLFHIGSVCAARRTANMRTAKTPPPPPSPPPTPPRLRQSDFQTIFGWFGWRVVRVAFVLGATLARRFNIYGLYKLRTKGGSTDDINFVFDNKKGTGERIRKLQSKDRHSAHPTTLFRNDTYLIIITIPDVLNGFGLPLCLYYHHECIKWFNLLTFLIRLLIRWTKWKWAE